MEQPSFGNQKDIDIFLKKITEEFTWEDATKKEHLMFLGNKVKHAIIGDEPLKDQEQIVLKEIFCQAVDVVGRENTAEELELLDKSRKISDEAKKYLAFYRESFIKAVSRMERYPHQKDELVESLSAFTQFVFNGKCTKDEKLPCLRFLAYTVMGITDELKNAS